MPLSCSAIVPASGVTLRPDGAVDITGVSYCFASSKFPSLMNMFALLALKGEPGDHRITVTVGMYEPDNSVRLLREPYDTNVKGLNSLHSTLMPIEILAVPLARAGLYCLEVHSLGRTIARCDLLVEASA